MNTENLHVALQQSFNPDTNQRRPAEDIIKGLKHVEGSSLMLLEIAAEKQVQFEVRQAAAIHLKNLCKECWAERVSFTGISLHSNDGSPVVLLKEEDKEQVKVNLINALLSEPEKSIQDLLAETLHYISIYDFPQKWPALLPTLQHFIQQTDPSQALQIHNALVALRKVCKRYEYKAKEERGPLNAIVDQFFPYLLPLAQRLVSPQENSLEAALTLKQILKIFWSSTQFFIPESAGGATVLCLSNPPTLQPWFEILEKTLSKPLPEASTGLEPLNQPESKEDRESWPWWKVKKWASQIMVRLFSRYGVPSYVEKEGQVFAQYFSKHAAPQFLGPVCETLNLRPSGKFCTDRVIHLCLSFVDLATELASTYKMLKPHLEFILYKVCFPTICLSPDDQDLFDNDPHEFIHKQNSPLNDFVDPRTTSLTVVNNLVKHRGQDVISGLLTFLNDILQNYSNGSQDHIQKEGSLQIIGSLAVPLFQKKKYVSQIEPLLVTHVFPEFRSQVGFLRYRACCMVQDFDFVKWTDGGSNLNNLINFVLQSLSDNALPVQIEASKALRSLIKVEGADKTLLPCLPQILQEYFRIMNEIGNDEVISALQTIIDKFGDSIEPHAVALVNELGKAFSSYCTAGEDDDDATMAAMQCLECISTVLKGVCERPDIYKSLEPILLPIVKQILGNEGEYIEYLENALDILTFLTFFQEEITPSLWETFPLMYMAFDQWAFDYLYLMIPPIENFIGKARETFLNGVVVIPAGTVKYIDLVFSMVKKTNSENRAIDSERRKALSLYMTILHNCHGLVDNYIPAINDEILGCLRQSTDEKEHLTRIAMFQVIGSALHYNPKLELEELEKRGVTEDVFTLWIKDSDQMESWLSRKITVLGFASIMLLPASSLPPKIASGISHIIACMTRLMELMETDSQIPDPEEDIGEERNNVQNDDEDVRGFGEDEDVYNVDDEPFINSLHDEFARFLIGDDWENEDDDDYVSPIDDIDTLLFYTESLTNAFQREPAIASSLAQPVVASYQRLCEAAVTSKAKKDGGM